MRTFIKYLLLFIVITHGAKAVAQVTIDAPKTVGVDETYFQVRFSVATADAAEIAVQGLNNFEKLAGPNISRSRSSANINGRVTTSESTTFTYTLAPQRKGTFTIGPATVKVGSRVYTSKTQEIKVVDGGGGRGGSGNASQGGGDEQLRRAGSSVSESDLYISALLNRKTVYEQEAVLLTYRFFERPGVGLNSVGLSRKPDFKGVVSQELPMKGIDANAANVGGKVYRCGNVQQYVLFPQQTGEVTIPGLTFDCVVMQRDAYLDPLDAFFNGGGNIGVTLKRTVAPVTLTVKPLPLPKPSGFSGGVGQFEIKGELLDADVRTNDIMTYRLTVTGNGNMKMLSAPVITFPTDFDTYAPKTVDKTEIKADGVTGSVSFDYTFTPRNIGHYEIPAVSFVYFDPEQAAYRTINVPAVDLEVKKGTKSNEDYERERRLRESDIRDISRGAVNLQQTETYYWWGSLTYWLSYVLAAVIIGATTILLYRRNKAASDTVRVRRNKAAKTALKVLKAAGVQQKKGDVQAFYAEIAKALRSYLSDKLSVPAVDLTRERISAELADRSVSDAVADGFCALLDECEYVRFAPSSAGADMNDAYQRAARIIGDLERELKAGNGKPTAS